MTPVTLVGGGSAAAREAAIAAAIGAARAAEPPLPVVALLEGLADGRAEPALAAGPHLQIIRIAAGCPCCVGNLTLRVSLNRILRRPPAHLYIGLASAGHLPQIRDFLCQPPYCDLLQLNPELRIDSNS